MTGTYMVFVEGNRAPTVEHMTEAEARAEAGRLAAGNPTLRIFVLAVVDVLEPAGHAWRSGKTKRRGKVHRRMMGRDSVPARVLAAIQAQPDRIFVAKDLASVCTVEQGVRCVLNRLAFMGRIEKVDRGHFRALPPAATNG